MAADIAPELHKRIERLYISGITANPIIAALREQKGKSYYDAQKYAIQVGKSATRAMLTVLTPDVLPEGRMFYNIAQRTVRPVLTACYETVAEFCAEVQEEINALAGVGITAIKPELNDSRISGIVNRLTNGVEFEQIKWILDAPVQNFAQAVVDDSTRENAKFLHEAGLDGTITRSPNGTCCEWCDNLAGSYGFGEDLPDEFYMRHDNCNCVISHRISKNKTLYAWANQVGQLTRKTQARIEAELEAERRRNGI